MFVDEDSKSQREGVASVLSEILSQCLGDYEDYCRGGEIINVVDGHILSQFDGFVKLNFTPIKHFLQDLLTLMFIAL
jgi:hypothetical protein